MNEVLKIYLKQWIEKAEEDLQVVHQLMTMDNRPKGAIGFHCQQAAEKFLKTFLVYHQSDVPKTHNIEFLLEQCKITDPEFPDIDLHNITDFGVEIRYPGDFLEPSEQELDVLIQIASEIKSTVLKKIKI
jgi:HEPN domain-containing protein